MRENEVLKRAFAMPLTNPAYPPGPYRFVNREYLIITYRTDPAKLRSVVPAPLELDEREALVKYEFIRMPDSMALATTPRAAKSFRYRSAVAGAATLTACSSMARGPIAGGRELWGFPKKLAQPTLRTEVDTLAGTLDYGPLRVATGTMGCKHRAVDLTEVKAALEEPNFLLKIIPHVDGSPRICELVDYHLEQVVLKGAWTGPAALSLTPHALAPVAELPVLEIVSAIHILADLTLGLGKVVHDYLQQPIRRPLRSYERTLVT
jgi:acetoacetate decarboxylase